MFARALIGLETKRKTMFVGESVTKKSGTHSIITLFCYNTVNYNEEPELPQLQTINATMSQLKSEDDQQMVHTETCFNQISPPLNGLWSTIPLHLK